MYIIKGGSAVVIYGEPPYQLEKDNLSEKWAKSMNQQCTRMSSQHKKNMFDITSK